MAEPPAPDWVGLYLLEDLGAGDVTSDALGLGDAATCRLVARERLVVAGLEPAAEVYRRLGARLEPRLADGADAAPGTVLATVTGTVACVLAGERVVLNLVARMSGIATSTRELGAVLRSAGSPARVAATRKTTPGFRAFEKQAVAVGGGDPHRMGLWDAAMLKDNHLEAVRAAGKDIAWAVARVRARTPGISVEVEVERLADAEEAARAGVEWILIDNQAPAAGAAWAARIRELAPTTRIEASGGITPQTLAAYGWADRVSLGWLTHKAVAKDVGLDWGDA